jgi:hypothetical protein
MNINCPAATAAGSDRRFTHPLPQVVLISTLLIVASIACTANTSVNSQPVAKRTTEPQQTASTGSQEKVPCTLTLVGSPIINGLRLGMTSDEILTLFPGSKDDPDVRRYLVRPPDPFGDAELMIRPSKYQSKDDPVRIKQISFGLLNGKAYTINIGFNGPAYAHVDRFVEALSKEATLPPLNEWEDYVGMSGQMKTLSCKEFEVQVFAGGPGGNLNYVLLKDLVAEKKLNDLRDKAAAQASPTP